MKKKIIAPFFIVAALMLVVSQVSFAQDMEGKIGIGARVAYVNYSDDDLGYGIDMEFDEVAMYGGNLTYFVHSYLSLELSVDYVETDVDSNRGTHHPRRHPRDRRCHQRTRRSQQSTNRHGYLQ